MKLSVLSFIIFIFVIVSLVSAQQESITSPNDSLKTALMKLEKRLQVLEEKNSDEELKNLQEEAESAAEEKPQERTQKTFKSGQRSLQAINPEISVTGDAYAQAILNDDGFTKTARSGANFRMIGLHFQSNLDPFSFTKIALGITPNGIGIGEAYVTWNKLFGNISLTAGKFRQQFGVINRWHVHALDQFSYPLALRTILGPAGLNQTGISLNWLMPSLIAHSNMLTVEITNGQNAQLFSGKMFSFPALLGHLKSYYDLSENTYLEWGVSGMWGTNNLQGYDNNGIKIEEDNRNTYLAGFDFSLFWEPLNQSHYHSFLWRSELYYVNKEIAPDTTIKAWGGYSYLEYKLNERFYSGIRFDYTLPFELNNDDKYTYAIVPYVTWWQSHWVRFRLQYNYTNGTPFASADQKLRLQLTWAIGPHKHDRY
jgi:hypothetical protein